MKVSVEITPGVKEPYAVIYTAQVTEEIQRTMDLLGTKDAPVTACHEEKLLILPETIEQPDIEDTESSPTPIGEDNGIQPDNNQRKQQVQDFDFGDDFW